MLKEEFEQRRGNPGITKKEKSMPELLTVKEVAEILRVSERTVRHYIENKKIPAIQLSGAIRIRKEDLDRILATEAK